MSQSTNTIVTVPDWARDYVKQYFQDAVNIWKPGEAQPTIIISSGIGAMGTVNMTAVNSGGDEDDNNLKVKSVTITYGGMHYSLPPLVTFSAPTGTMYVKKTAQGYAVLNYRGEVGFIVITEPGYGYNTAATVSISSSGVNATAEAVMSNGVITAINVTNGGSGYLSTEPPIVLILGGGGSGAVAHAVVSGDQVTSIVVDNGGQGYGQTISAITAYHGTTTAPQDANELTGINALATRGKNGNATITAASAYVKDVIDGDYLNGSSVMPVITTMKARNADYFTANVQPLIGRNALFTDTNIPLARTLAVPMPAVYNARMEAKILHADYQSERSSMETAMGYGIEFGKQPLVDAEALRKSGLYAREYLQGTYEIDHKLYIETEELKIVGLEVFGNALRALTGSTQSTSESYSSPNTMMQAVGMVSQAVGVYNALANTGLFASSAASMAGAGAGAMIGLEAGGMMAGMGAAAVGGSALEAAGALAPLLLL